MTQEATEMVKSYIDSDDIVIFMKGTAEAPMCGFSAQTVKLMQSYGVPFTTVNVLEDEEVREEVKKYSNWPTIPQVYIKGVFVGGCDICNELHARGELEKMAKEASGS